MNIGFTGTRHGMTEHQKEYVARLVTKAPVLGSVGEALLLHHGDCVGADAEMHDLWVNTHGDYAPIVIHPPAASKHRAFKNSQGTILLSPQDYLERDREIVHQSDLVIATPRQEVMINRSGTWYTVRYAWKMGVPTIVIPPILQDVPSEF